jgi:hypothetical protein
MQFVIRLVSVILLLILMFKENNVTIDSTLPEYNIVIKNHHFIPDKLVIPAGSKIKLTVENQDNSAEEFESLDLKREKIIPAGGTITMVISPLSPGIYRYFGEFHEDTAHGILEVN